MSHLRIEFFEPDGSTPPWMGPRNHTPSTANLVASAWVKNNPGRRARISSDQGEPMYDIRATENPRGFYVIERLEAAGEQIPTQCEGCGHPKHLGLCMAISDCECGADRQEEGGYIN